MKHAILVKDGNKRIEIINDEFCHNIQFDNSVEGLPSIYCDNKGKVGFSSGKFSQEFIYILNEINTFSTDFTGFTGLLVSEGWELVRIDK